MRTPVQLRNTSTGVTSYFWNFCSGSVYSSPEVTSLGGLGGVLKDPVFTAIAKDGNDFYVFVINNTDNRLVRLFFGNSLLNNPVVTQIGNVNIPDNAEGIQVVQDAAGWHIIVVGGTTIGGSRVVTINFGTSLANNTPVGTDWGNIGNMAYPIDLYVFEDGGNYYGFTCNSENNTVTRLDFGNDFSQPPVGVNLGNIGGLLNAPTGIFAIQENGNWYLIVTNERDSKLIRLDFGTSLLNVMPVAVDLGNPGNALNHPRDISLIRECGQIMAIAVNGREPGTASGGAIARFIFQGGITGVITGHYLGNPGNLFDLPHAISSIFRAGNDLYAFVPNARNGTLTRMSFKSCTDASIPSSTAASPPSFQYNSPGIYTINLITDEGTPTQQTICKNIVVVEPPRPDLGADITMCEGQAADLDAGNGFKTYSWSNGSTSSSIRVNSSGTYRVTVTNSGCSATDEIEVSISQALTLNARVLHNVDCKYTSGEAQIDVQGGTAPYNYALDGNAATTDPVFTSLAAGDYTVTVTDALGCTSEVDFTIINDNTRMLSLSASATMPSCAARLDGSVTMQVTQGIPPFEYALSDGAFQVQPVFTGLGEGTYKLYGRNSYCLDSVEIELTAPAPLEIAVFHGDETCSEGNGWVELDLDGGTIPYSISWEGNTSLQTEYENLAAGSYQVIVSDANGCTITENVRIENVMLPTIRILNNDTTINIGDQIVLQAVNGIDYRWEPADGSLSCFTCSTTIAKPVRETLYIVRTTTGTSCNNADSVLVKLTYFRSLIVPNAFTPNNDGQNDYFRPASKGVVAFDMAIYNRWGELIFKTLNPKTGWDGNLNGQKQPAGTYVYMINYGFYNESGKIVMQSRKGTFTLIR